MSENQEPRRVPLPEMVMGELGAQAATRTSRENVVDTLNAMVQAELRGAFLPELNDDLTEILGMVNFRCGPIAHLFRTKGGKDIKPHSEEEQAFVIHWLLGLYFEHGPQWRTQANLQISLL